MSYQVLARKWRPRNFQEMVGQEHVLRALVNALEQQRLHHAYLFTGTRGVGKTTLARIIAKSLNCETNGITATPCGTCSACQEIDQGRFIDLIEVDAASRTKVEDTRELLENVQYAPSRGRYKVYLIDEVHMLSTHSFNALLKTLEEPPPHVKFLLATTDPQKLPGTVLSRCLQFNLKRMPIDQIVQHLNHILEQEKIQFETMALKHLAVAADGSMRDALSLLDQAIAYGQGAVKTQDVIAMLGHISADAVQLILAALAQHDANAVLTHLQALHERAPDFEAVLDALLAQIHQLILAQMVPNALDDALVDPETIKQLSQQFSLEDLQLYYQIGLIGKRDLYYAPNPYQGLEMILLRMLAFRPADSDEGSAVKKGEASTIRKVAASDVRLDQLNSSAVKNNESLMVKKNNSAAIVSTKPATVPPVTAMSEEAAAPVIVRKPAIEAVVSKLNPPVFNEKSSEWMQIVSQLSLKGMLAQLAANCALKSKDDHKIVLVLADEHKQLHNKSFEERLRAALSTHFQKELKLQIDIGKPDNATPAVEKARQIDERKQAAVEEIQRDEVVRALKEKLNAEVQIDSVRPID